jgi:hypothetical protein
MALSRFPETRYDWQPGDIQSRIFVTMYPRALEPLTPFEIFSASSRESLPEAVVFPRAVRSRKPGRELTENQESLLVKMVHNDKTWAEIGRHFPGHTLHSLKENFFTRQGGKPRVKAGVKAGAVLETREYD